MSSHDGLHRARLLARSGAISEAIGVLTLLSQKGDAQAMTELAILYIQNKDAHRVTNNQIRDLLHNAVELGNEQADEVLVQFLMHMWTGQPLAVEPPENQSGSGSKQAKPNPVFNSQPAQQSSSQAEQLALQTLVDSGDPEGMAHLAALYLRFPDLHPEPFAEAHRLITQSILSGNASAKTLLTQLGQSMIQEKKFSSAEIVLYESLAYGNQDAVPLLLSTLRNPGVELKQAFRNVTSSLTTENILLLIQKLRRGKHFRGAEYWLLRLEENGHLQSKIELADLYRLEMKNSEKFNSLLERYKTSSPFHHKFLLGQLSLDQNHYSAAQSLFEDALDIDPRSFLPIVQIHKIFDIQENLQGFIDWILEESKRRFIPLLETIADRFRSLDQIDDFELWTGISKVVAQAISKEHSTTQVLSHLDHASVSASNSDLTPYEIWLRSGHEHIKATYIHSSSKFLHTLFELNRGFCPIIGDWMRYFASEDWLDEILAKYEDQSLFLKLEPEWPIRFESAELQIVLAVEGQWLRGWVGRDGTGGLVAIRITDFEIHSALNEDDLNFSVGVVTALFLDRTINLDSDDHPHFNIQINGTYWGTNQFDNDIKLNRSGQRRPMQSHMVSGFPRKLPDGYTASHEAIMRAPIYIRRNLRPDQTFVRRHQRNGPVVKENILRYLRENSNLADAIGSTEQIE
jgi:uncharacterized protein HemY